MERLCLSLKDCLTTVAGALKEKAFPPVASLYRYQ